MKRDLELVRDILKWMEARDEGLNSGEQKIQVEGFTEDQIGYHIHLMGQAGLLVTVDLTHLQSTTPTAHALSMTWQGHEFLDATKDSALWAKAKKSVIAPAGGVAFTVLLEWLKQEALNRLGIPTTP